MFVQSLVVRDWKTTCWFMSKGQKTWFPLDRTAFLPVVALMLSSHGGYQQVGSSAGLGAGCVPAANAL